MCLIPVLLMLVSSFKTTDDDFIRGDCNYDNRVDIDDVTTLISYILNGYWPDNNPEEPGNVTFVVNGIEINMVYVEGGTFTMGASGTDTEANDNEFPAHIVTLSPYYICATEVTQQLWRAVMGSNPSLNTGNVLCPVECVSWTECQEFISTLNEMTGKNFRMPTEAEWEYAARGGNKSMGYKYSGSNTVGDVAWYNSNAGGKSHQVATKLPNELGLYDMSGNVGEWCLDWYDGYYATDSQMNPQGPSSGTTHVVRSCYYYHNATNCRNTFRSGSFKYNNRYASVGLRLAM